MSDVKWIKISTDIFDNRKIRQIEVMPEGDAVLIIWIKLICLAGRINDNGMVYFTPEIPYTEEMLATQFNRPIQTIRLALTIFEKFGMIERVNDFLCLPSWEKYQSADRLERMREKNRERQARFRERHRAELPENNADVTQEITPCNALDKEKDIEKEKEEEIKKEEKKEAGKKSGPKLSFDYSSTNFSEPMIASVESWLRYKSERRDAYKPTGLKSLITQIQNKVNEYGEQAVMGLIADCMAANYKGIIWDKLTRKNPIRGGGSGQNDNVFLQMREERRGRG